MTNRRMKVNKLKELVMLNEKNLDCKYFNQWKKLEKELTLHMNHLPGDRMFVDFAGNKLYITDKSSGKKRPVEVFVAILGNSEYSYVEDASTDNIEIFYDNQRIALHKRIKSPGYTTVEEHRSPSHNFYLSWNKDRFLDWASKIGDNCKALIENIIEKADYPEQSYKVCLGIINLKKYYDEKRLDNASKRALYFGCLSYKSVKSILEKDLDRLEEQDLFNNNKELPEHNNVRGKQYYLNGGKK